jgi:hypothetical protein
MAGRRPGGTVRHRKAVRPDEQGGGVTFGPLEERLNGAVGSPREDGGEANACGVDYEQVFGYVE